MCLLMALCKLPRCGCLSSRHFFTHLTLFRVDCVHRINNLYNTRWGTISICYINYCVTITGIVATFFTHLTLFKVDFVHRINNLYNTRWGNNKCL